MKKKIAIAVFILLIFVSGILIYNFYSADIDNNEELKQSIFDVYISDVYIIPGESYADSNTDTADYHDRIVIKVSIDNNTDKDYKNVEYYLRLNEEAKPYIASGIIEFHQEKMDVISQEKFKELKKKGKLNSMGTPVIWGFEHEWNMSLTDEEYLRNYFDITPDGLADALKSVTVTIKWDGGEQVETVPLHL